MLCECGLDPGLDHMLAMEVMDKVTARGGQVSNFLLLLESRNNSKIHSKVQMKRIFVLPVTKS